MKTVLIRYHYRLGDIVRCFPIARHYAAQGNEVLIECSANYHGIFKAISYAKPTLPGVSREVAQDFNPQIWPARYDDFRKSGLRWMDYVYSLYRGWDQIDRAIVFDRIDQCAPKTGEYGMPEKYSIISPFSMSSRHIPLPRIFQLAQERMDLENTYLFMSHEQQSEMIARGFEPTRALTVKHLSHLPALLRDAQQVLTVNTSTTIIASAVRDNYIHIVESNVQDNWSVPNQTPILP